MSENANAPTHAERARTLVAQAVDGTLSTLFEPPPGAALAPEPYPFGSRVLFALHEGDPVLLISELATHTAHLRRSARASLLVHEAGDDPLALGRVTLVGDVAPTDDPVASDVFLARHPDARRYAGFRDFGFWRLRVGAVRYVGGFGRMSWVDPAAWYAATPDPIAPHAAGILAHMNEDHRDALPLYARAFSRAGEVDQVTMTGVDRYGFELSAVTADGPRPVRIAFPEVVGDPNGVRLALIALLNQARAQLGVAR